MIRQPWGGVLALLTLIISLFVAGGLLEILHALLPAVFERGMGSLCIGAVLSLTIFSLALELGHRLEIVLFCRKRGAKVLRIRAFRNHYRVSYLRAGETMTGKWPEDFRSWN